MTNLQSRTRARMGSRPQRWIAVFVCLCFFLSFPICANAEGETWDAILAANPDRPVELLDGDLNLYADHDWQQAFDDLAEQGMENVRVFSTSGTEIEPLGGEKMCTGQHACFYFGGYEGGIRLFDVVVYGDVLGTGELNITQMVRLARAVNGTKPLAGVYLVAGDINRGGSIDISDLVTLASWIAAA